MKYWLNVHWPPFDVEEERANWRYWVFLQRRSKDIQPGDLIFVYETLNDPRVRRGIRGRQHGRQSIIALVQAVSGVEPNPGGRTSDILEDGRQVYWRFRVRTKQLEPQEGSCSLSVIRRVLQYGNRWYPRVPGGLKELTKAQFDSLREQFR